MFRTVTNRALLACCALACVFTGFSWRLIYLQVYLHEEYVLKALENHGGRQLIYARRGMIQDVRGWPLAQNEPVKTVIADGSLIKDRPALAALLAGPLQMKENVLLEMLSREQWSDRERQKVPLRYIVLKTKVPEATAQLLSQKLAAAEVKSGAITFKQESIRVYPNGEMLCHVVGYMNHTNAGVEGVERSMNDYLRGHDGFRYTEHDRTGKEMVPYRGAERPPRHGCNVRLTVDSQIQMIVESELQKAVKEFNPITATSIVMRPQTGEIMALANYPHFNLNDPAELPMINRKNPAIMSIVEPGSTFKIVTTAAALGQKLVRPDTSIFCENGHFTYGGNTLHDHKNYGELTVSEILIHSSNVGVAKLAIQLGDQRLYDYVRRFGFGERTGVALPGEIPGKIRPLHQWEKMSITHVPMGQEVTATPLQIVSAMSVIANGGHLMLPQLIHDITDSDGAPVASFAPVEVRQVVPESVCADVRSMLSEVVSKKGTAAEAAVPGFIAAGKTGTAQISDGKTYIKDKYVCSFVGFLPADHPEFVCLVLLHSPDVPHEMNFGGRTAAPVFSRIAKRVAEALDLVPAPELMGQGPVAANTRESVRD